MASGVLFSSGFLLSAFAPNLETCVFSIGILAGNSIKSKSSYKKSIGSSRELLSNNSQFGGQLLRRSNHERAARVIYHRTTERHTVNYYSTIRALELIFFNSNTQ